MLIIEKKVLQPPNPCELIPNEILDAFIAKDWKVLESITLKNRQRVTENTFVSLKNNESLNGTIVCVQQIWGTRACAEQQTIIKATRCRLGQVSSFYGMREIKETNAAIWINVRVSKCCVLRYICINSYL